MDIIKSIKSWKPKNGFQRKSKSLSHSQQQENLQTLQRMNNEVENKEIIPNIDPMSNNRLYAPSSRPQTEYWTNESISSNASTSILPLREDMSSCSASSSFTNNSSRVATTLPAGNPSLELFQDYRAEGKDIGKWSCSDYIITKLNNFVYHIHT